MNRSFTAFIQREDDMYVSLCPELEIASQGETVQEARENLREAIQLFLEEADSAESQSPRQTEQYVSSVEVSVG